MIITYKFLIFYFTFDHEVIYQVRGFFTLAITHTRLESFSVLMINCDVTKYALTDVDD